MAVAQNSGRTAVRVPGRPFPKGVSGNPGGRPRGFVHAIREATNDGDELVQFMLSVLRGEVAGTRLRDRVEAATWLADRGFGRPAPAESPGRAEDERISLETLTRHRTGVVSQSQSARRLRGQHAVISIGTRLRDQIEAATWLADRGFGRPQRPRPARKTNESRLTLYVPCLSGPPPPGPSMTCRRSRSRAR